MASVRERLDSWTVPPALAALVVIGAIVAVLVVEIGARQQRARTIPLVSSVTICTSSTTQSLCSAPDSTRATLGKAQATSLARAINALPNHARNIDGCAMVETPMYRLTFATSGRPVIANFQPEVCPTIISFTEVGQAWGAQRFDWNGVVIRLVTHDLRATA